MIRKDYVMYGSPIDGAAFPLFKPTSTKPCATVIPPLFPEKTGFLAVFYQSFKDAKVRGTAYGVQRRMADWSFEKAQTWEDLIAAHEKWLLDHTHQRRMANVEREDNSRLTQAMGWQRGMQPEPELIYRAFSALGEMRVLNKAGYAAFRNFLLYGEQGLAGRETPITIFRDTLAVEYGGYPLSKRHQEVTRQMSEMQSFTS